MKLQFTDWIETYGGIEKLSKTLKINPHTIRVWLRGDGSPRPKTINRIIRLSKGKLTFETVFSESTRSKKC